MKQTMFSSERGPLAEAAHRLAQLERSLRGRNGDMARGEEQRSYDVSPDEDWSRRFMNQGIGPQPEPVPINGMETLAKAQHAFRLETSQPMQATTVVRAAPLEVQRSNGPIGLQIGKPIRRRLFTRLFGR